MAVYSFHEWCQQVASSVNVANVQHVCPPDVQPHVTGYMVAPCDVVDGQLLVATSVRWDSLDEVIQCLADASCDNDIYLYRILELVMAVPNPAGAATTSSMYLVRYALQSKMTPVELVP